MTVLYEIPIMYNSVEEHVARIVTSIEEVQDRPGIFEIIRPFICERCGAFITIRSHKFELDFLTTIVISFCSYFLDFCLPRINNN